jgi:hypothetical protein
LPAEVQSIWPDGLTAWLSEPLPPQSTPVLLDDAPSASSKTSPYLISEPVIKITFLSAAGMVSSSTSQTQLAPSARASSSSFRRRFIRNPISSPRNFYPASSPSFFPCHRQSLQFSFSAILLALLLLLWFTLTSTRLLFRLRGRDSAPDPHPVRQLWHVMVP